MKFHIRAWALSLLSGALLAAQNPPANPKSVTVPAVIDHNRVIITVDLRLPDGSTESIPAWINTGDPDLRLSRRLATLLGLAVRCDERECAATAPRELEIAGMPIPLSEIKEARIPLRPVHAAAVMAAGLKAEITLPSSILRHYDVLVDFPGHKFSIGMPGTIHFRGSSGKVEVIPANGLILVPSQIEKQKFNLLLDLGASISFLPENMFDKLGAAHTDWPRMTGAVGPVNAWGMDEETKDKVMRVDRLQSGPLFLTDAAVTAMPKSLRDAHEALGPAAGVLGSQLLQNYRLGIDYAHSTVYFEIGRTFNFPDFDVVGLMLRPEDDGRFTVMGVAEFEGKPSAPSGPDGIRAGDELVAVNDIPVRGATMGQVWSLLGGIPGQEKRLTISGGGKERTIPAQVQHFLAAGPEQKQEKQSPNF